MGFTDISPIERFTTEGWFGLVWFDLVWFSFVLFSFV